MPYEKVISGNGAIFIIELFGVKVFFNCDVKDDREKIGWRTVYIYPKDDVALRKDELSWELIKSGYLNYIRTQAPKLFKRLITLENWDKKLLNKRIQRYADHPKYNYLRDEALMALEVSPVTVLATEPGFYDYLLDID
jgi:hypothetical protein